MEIMLGALRKGSKVPWFDVGFRVWERLGSENEQRRIHRRRSDPLDLRLAKHGEHREAPGRPRSLGQTQRGRSNQCCVQTESIEHDQMNQHNQLHIVSILFKCLNEMLKRWNQYLLTGFWLNLRKTFLTHFTFALLLSSPKGKKSYKCLFSIYIYNYIYPLGSMFILFLYWVLIYFEASTQNNM